MYGGNYITGRASGTAILTIRLEGGKLESSYTVVRDPIGAGRADLWIFTDQDAVKACYPGWRRMKEGERVRVYIRFYLEYSRDYWGEHDVEGYIAYIRTLRKHKAGKYYEPKADRARHKVNPALSCVLRHAPCVGEEPRYAFEADTDAWVSPSPTSHFTSHSPCPQNLPRVGPRGV